MNRRHLQLKKMPEMQLSLTKEKCVCFRKDSVQRVKEKEGVKIFVAEGREAEIWGHWDWEKYANRCYPLKVEVIYKITGQT